MHELMRKSATIYTIAIILSLLLSCWMGLRESVINPDAICYLQSAANMKYGLSTGMHICGQAKWPFYSVIIYAIHTVTSFSFEASAYLIDGIFTVVSVITFLAILRCITDKPRILWFGAAVILLAHEFNSVRQYIIRDHGFWAFYLLSIYFLIKHFTVPSQSWRYALAWSSCAIIATLFRVEGAVFLLLIPLISFFNQQNRIQKNLKNYLQLNAMTLSIIGVMLVCMGLNFHLEISRLEEVRYHLMNGIDSIYQHLSALKNSLAQHVLTHDSENEAGLILFFVMFGWYFYSIIFNLSLIYSVLVIYAWFKRAMPKDKFIHLVLWGYVIVNVLITVSFLIENLFLSKRYLIGLSLVFMFWVPFALDKIVEQRQEKKWLSIVVLSIIVLSSLGGIFDFGYSKQYIHDAGNWLDHNTPQHASIYANDYQLMYYSHRFERDMFDKAPQYVQPQAIADGKWKQYDYLALRINKQQLQTQANNIHQIQYKLVQVFSNKRGDQVRIYQRG